MAKNVLLAMACSYISKLELQMAFIDFYWITFDIDGAVPKRQLVMRLPFKIKCAEFLTAHQMIHLKTYWM